MLRDEMHALGEAERIGYPVLIKPSAGGGGKGMRMVRTGRELESVLRVCRSEAKAAFGDDSLYLEKWLDENRHVEIQVAIDRYGHGVHMGERDCSVQRRHQKILEEAPTPALSDAARTDLAERAVKAAIAAGYENVGTLEFLVDAAGDFFFIEINCRIQVEHPVTEILTGLDLVTTQIRIAAGEPLGFSQADVTLRGHAIEFRINAEDPEHEFRPGAGVVERYHAPGGPGVRMDSHLYSGYEVPPFYDSLLGKLIVWGPDRATAIARGRVALDELVVDGLVTNVSIHKALLVERGVPRGTDDDEPARPRRERGIPRRGGAIVSRAASCRPAQTALARLGGDRPTLTPTRPGVARDRNHPLDPRDRSADPASLAVPARRPHRRVRRRGEADRRDQGRHRERVVFPGPLPGPAGDARRHPGRGARPDDGGLRRQAAGVRRPDRPVRGHRRLPLQARRQPG